MARGTIIIWFHMLCPAMAGQAHGVSVPHTSIPRDAEAPAEPTGRSFLVVMQEQGSAPEEWHRLPSSDCEVLLPGVVPARTAAASPGPAIDSLLELERIVSDRLASARVGLRLYIAGSDAFIRRIQRPAFEMGVLPTEIFVAVTGDEIRVWCTHCKAITEAPAFNLLECTGCGRQLLVYHHFSRRHGAYMGFQADAEAHGELPERKSGMPWA